MWFRFKRIRFREATRRSERTIHYQEGSYNFVRSTLFLPTRKKKRKKKKKQSVSDNLFFHQRGVWDGQECSSWRSDILKSIIYIKHGIETMNQVNISSTLSKNKKYQRQQENDLRKKQHKRIRYHVFRIGNTKDNANSLVILRIVDGTILIIMLCTNKLLPNILQLLTKRD